MKNDLATAIIAAVLGVLGAYFICNMLIPPIENVKFKVIDGSVNADVATPDPEVFNYKALNPTVEVYIGKCNRIGQNGECLDDYSEQTEDNTNTNPDQGQEDEDEGDAQNGTSN